MQRANHAFLHYQVLFASNGAVHRMELWRDRDRRIKRVTDQALVTYATRKAGDVGYTLKVLDLKRRISTLIDRTNLYRIGSFTDWYDLSHGLRHPKGAYRLVAAQAAPVGIAANRADLPLVRSDRGTAYHAYLLGRSGEAAPAHRGPQAARRCGESPQSISDRSRRRRS